MNASDPHRRHVVVLLESDVLGELADRLPADRYRLGYLRDPEEFLRLHAEHPVDVAVTPLEAPLPLANAVRLLGFRDGVRLVATTERTERFRAGDDGPAIYEAVVPRSDADAIVAAVLAAVGERRAEPRVVVRLPVTFAAGGRATTEDVSASAFRIRTTTPLTVGERVRVVVHDGIPCAVIARVDAAREVEPPGTWSLVLRVKDLGGVHAGLGALVHRHLCRGHLPEARSDLTGLSGPAAWQLARRAEHRAAAVWSLAGPGAGALPPGLRAQIPERGLVARYVLGAEIEAPGDGWWCEGIRRLSGRPVWIRRLRPAERTDREARARIELAARAGGELLGLPGAVPVVDFGSDGEGGLYCATPRLDGEPLARFVARGERLGATDLARLGSHLATALAEAHRRGVVHGGLDARRVWLEGRPGEPLAPRVAGFGDLPGAAPRGDAEALLGLLGRLAAAWGETETLLPSLAVIEPGWPGCLGTLALRLARLAEARESSAPGLARIQPVTGLPAGPPPDLDRRPPSVPEPDGPGGETLEGLFSDLSAELREPVAFSG